jgi:type 1 glutamine amidotransferase
MIRRSGGIRTLIPLLGLLAALVIIPSSAIPAAADAPAADAPAADAPAAPPRRRVLLITGEDFKGHLWRQTTPALRIAIESDTRLAVEVLDDLAQLATTDLTPYHAVVLHFKNYKPDVPGRAAFDKLLTFAHAGGGVVLVHFACGAFQEFRGEFEPLAGRVWDPKLRGHDKYGPFTVQITDPAHPVTAGLRNFDTTDELYTCLAGTTTIRTLAVAQSKVDRSTHPMAFVLDYGKGRVFHSPLGHDVAALSNPQVGELFRRGTAWVAGLDPSVPLSSPAPKEPSHAPR